MSGGEANIWQPRTIIEVKADTKMVTQPLTALVNQTLFTITDFAYTVGTGALQVYRNGEYLTPNVDFVEQTATTFTVVAPSTAGDEIVAVGNTGIEGTVDVRDTDIYLTNHQALRDYAGVEETIYIQGTVTKGDGGENFFQKFIGAAPGTYVDDDINIIIPTGGNGSIGWLRSGTIHSVDSIFELPTSGLAGQTIEVRAFYTPNLALANPYDKGGDKFVWEAATTKISANGITKIDPAAFNGWGGSAMATTADYFDATNGQGGSAITGNGIWRRQFSNLLDIEAAGALNLAADSTDNLQAFINFLSAKGGGAMFVSAGTYNHIGLTWKSGVQALGENRHNAIIQYTPATGDAITGGADISRFGLENIYLKSNNASTGWAVFFDLSTVRQPRIVNCAITGFLKGIKIDDGLQGVIDQLFINGQGIAVAGGIGLQLGHDVSQSGTTWDVRSVYTTTLETGIVNWASLSHFKQIICEVCGVAVESNVAGTWDTIWSEANTDFWHINNNGITIRSFRRGGTTGADFTYEDGTVEGRTIVMQQAFDVAPSTAESIKLGTFRGYRDGKYLFHDTVSSDFAGILPGASNLEGVINLWGNTEAELKIAVARNTAAGVGKNMYLQAGGAKVGETDTGGGTLYLDGGKATGNERSDVRIRTASGGASGAADSTPVERWVFRSSGEFYPAADNTYDIGLAAVAPRDIYTNNAVTVTSDERYKDNITPEILGLDFINALKPVSYTLKAGSGERPHHGLIAQDFKQVIDAFGVDHAAYVESPIIDLETEEDTGEVKLGLRYEELISSLIKSVQELSARIETLEGK